MTHEHPGINLLDITVKGTGDFTLSNVNMAAGATVYKTEKSFFDDVVEFCQKLQQHPGILTKAQLTETYRREFMNEELREYDEAVAKGDVVGQVDALFDLIYVALGNIYLSGFTNGNEHWRAIHYANMQKVPGLKPGRESSGGMDAIKPPGWEGPERRHAELITQEPVVPYLFEASTAV